MAHKPVARLQVDTRGFGPVWCEKCESEQEEVVLSSDADFHCPDCGAALPEFDDMARFFTSAQKATGSEKLRSS